MESNDQMVGQMKCRLNLKKSAIISIVLLYDLEFTIYIARTYRHQ
jgi:hypothetical protein